MFLIIAKYVCNTLTEKLKPQNSTVLSMYPWEKGLRTLWLPKSAYTQISIVKCNILWLATSNTMCMLCKFQANNLVYSESISSVR